MKVKVGRRALAAAAFIYLLLVVNLHRLFVLQSDTSSKGGIDLLLRSSRATAGYEGNDVFQFDRLILENIRATNEGASSRIEYDGSMSRYAQPEKTLQAIPLMASVDRRPIVVRKQLIDDSQLKLTAEGDLLGCAMTATTFVTNLLQIDVDAFENKMYDDRHSCQLCFQFSNHHDMEQFLSNIGHVANNINTRPEIHTKCIAGDTNIYAHFAKWQQKRELKGERFHGFGYPWTVDCVLPNGIKELTCREISRMQQVSFEHNGLLDVRLETGLVLGVNKQQHNSGHETKQQIITVRSKWPWSALTSHDDDRSKIAKNISYSWNDENSWYVPKNAQEMKLAHVEGPGYDATITDGVISPRSDSSRGGVHVRFLVNLYHFIRNCPGSTHIIGEYYLYITKCLLRLFDSACSTLC